MILLSELSRRRIRSIQKLIRIGRNEVVVVLRVDKEKGGQLDVFGRNQLNSCQDTSICPNAECRRRISQNAKNDI